MEVWPQGFFLSTPTGTFKMKIQSSLIYGSFFHGVGTLQFRACQLLHFIKGTIHTSATPSNLNQSLRNSGKGKDQLTDSSKNFKTEVLSVKQVPVQHFSARE